MWKRVHDGDPARPETPSIKDVARLAGVSHSTVSRALRNSPRVNAETIEKIRRIAAESGYRASAVGRSLATRRTYTIGVVVTEVNTRQYHFLVARAYFALHMLHYRGDAAAARATTYIGDNTICAAIIAAVLHFHLDTCTRMK